MWATQMEQAGADTSDTKPPALTVPGSAHTKGTYVELIASTSFTAAYIQITWGFIGAGSGTHDHLTDLAVGAAASEVVLVADLLSSLNTRAFIKQAEIVAAVPSGSRLAARTQATTASAGSQQSMQVALFANSNITGDSSPSTYGADTTDTSGVEITDGAQNVKGAYAELTASTSGAHNTFVPMLGFQDRIGGLTNDYLFDIATGAAAAEVVLIPDFYFRISSSGVPTNAAVWNFATPTVSSGTRLSARMQTDSLVSETIDMVVVATNAAEPTAAPPSLNGHTFRQVFGPGGPKRRRLFKRR